MSDNALMLMQQNLPSFATQDVVHTGLDELATTSAPRISTEGGLMSVIVDGSVAAGPMHELDVIVIGVSPEARNVSRIFYAGKYVKGSKEAPTCFSDKGDVPSPHSTAAQAASCAQCPKNVKGSGDAGGTACGFYKRLAVIVPGVPDSVFELRVSARGIFSKTEVISGTTWAGLTAYASLLAEVGKKAPNVRMDMSKVITTISCPKGQTEGLRFAVKSWATEADYAEVVKAINSGERDRVLTSRLDVMSNVGDGPQEQFEQHAPTTPPAYQTPAQPAQPAQPEQPAYQAPPAPSTPTAYQAPVQPAQPVYEAPPTPAVPAQPVYEAPTAPAQPAQPAQPEQPVYQAPTATPQPEQAAPAQTSQADAMAALRAKMRKQQ